MSVIDERTGPKREICFIEAQSVKPSMRELKGDTIDLYYDSLAGHVIAGYVDDFRKQLENKPTQEPFITINNPEFLDEGVKELEGAQ